MTLSIVFVLVMLAILGFFVLKPLLNNSAHGLEFQKFENESDLRSLFDFRDALLAKLLGREAVANSLDSGAERSDEGPSETKAHDDWNKVCELSELEAFEALLRVCRILKRAGIPYLPLPASQQNHLKSSGFSNQSAQPPVSLLLAGLLAASALAGAAINETALAQDMPHGSMPGLSILDDGTALTQIHQFVLSPDQGQLRVFYLALFNADGEAQIKLRIPSPDHATDFDFSSMEQATLDPLETQIDKPPAPPVLNIPTKAGINQIQGSFTIPAPTGSLNWTSSFLNKLSGVVLIILPEYHDSLSLVWGGAWTGLNVWPPHLKTIPAGFEFKRTKEQPNERDPNFTRMKNPPDQYSLHYFRRAGNDAPYPEFVLHGLAPSRLPVLILIVTFGFVLAGIALFAAFRSQRPTAGSK